MSSIERNKGKLIPVFIDIEDCSDNDIDALYENGMVIIKGEVYDVQWEVKHKEDDAYFADVKVNPDGSIDFHTMHYNGGAYWTEVVEEGLNESCN